MTTTTNEKTRVLLEWMDDHAKAIVRVVAVPIRPSGRTPYFDLVLERRGSGGFAMGEPPWYEYDPSDPDAGRLIAIAVYHSMHAPNTDGG